MCHLALLFCRRFMWFVYDNFFFSRDETRAVVVCGNHKFDTPFIHSDQPATNLRWNSVLKWTSGMRKWSFNSKKRRKCAVRKFIRQMCMCALFFLSFSFETTPSKCNVNNNFLVSIFHIFRAMIFYDYLMVCTSMHAQTEIFTCRKLAHEQIERIGWPCSDCT